MARNEAKASRAGANAMRSKTAKDRPCPAHPAERPEGRAVRAALVALVCFAALGAVACGGADDSGGDMASGGPDGPDVGASSPPSGGPEAADVSISAVTERVYQVGSALSGEDWELFSRVTSVFFDGDGNLFALDAGLQRLVVVDPEGGLARIVGRRGGGPGEFEGAAAAALLPDGRLAVFEHGRPALFEILAPDGTPLETVPVDLRQTAAPAARLLPLPGGRLISAGGPRMTSTSTMTNETTGPTLSPDGRRPVDLYFLDGADPRAAYRAWGFPPTEQLDPVETGAGSTIRAHTIRAFAPGLHYDVLRDGRIAVVDSIGYRVKFVTTDGGVDGHFERPIQPLPVTESMKDAFRAYTMAAFDDNLWHYWAMARDAADASDGVESPAEAAMPSEWREIFVQAVSGAIFADVAPVIAGIAVDWEGRMWIARTGPDGVSDGPTDIVDPDGAYLGTLAADGLRTPTAFGPGGLLAYLERDDLDVQTIRVVRLVALEP